MALPSGHPVDANKVTRGRGAGQQEVQTLACQPWGGAAPHYRAVLTPVTKAFSTSHSDTAMSGLGSELSMVGRPNSEDNCPWQGPLPTMWSPEDGHEATSPWSLE